MSGLDTTEPAVTEHAALFDAVGVEAVALWTPGYGSVDAWQRRQPDGFEKPDASLIPRQKRRRTTFKTRMAAHVLARLPKVDLATVPTVFASVLGEVDAAVTLVDMLHTGEGALSPTRFQNSVHNTSAGLLSIATSNPHPSASVAATWDVTAMGLLEAAARVLAEETPVVLVVQEEAWPGILRIPEIAPLSVALLLVPEHTATLGNLGGLRRAPDGAVADHDYRPTLASNPCSGALVLVDALRSAGPTSVRLDLGGAQPEERWQLDVHPVTAQ